MTIGLASELKTNEPARLEASHLDFAYVKEKLAVRDVSLVSAARSLTAVIGANGSGKSTLIRMLAGLLRPLAGTITLTGVALDAWRPRAKAREMAYVPQSSATAFPFRVSDVVLSGRTPHVPAFRFEDDRDMEEAMAALESCGAAHLADRSFTSLSGGERQMVILARALAQRPRVLLLDEASSSLDLTHRADLVRTLVRLRDSEGLSVIMITHDLQFIGRFDQLLALRDGAMAAAGTPDEVLRDHIMREVYGDVKICMEKKGSQVAVWVDL